MYKQRETPCREQMAGLRVSDTPPRGSTGQKDRITVMKTNVDMARQQGFLEGCSSNEFWSREQMMQVDSKKTQGLWCLDRGE